MTWSDECTPKRLSYPVSGAFQSLSHISTGAAQVKTFRLNCGVYPGKMWPSKIPDDRPVFQKGATVGIGSATPNAAYRQFTNIYGFRQGTKQEASS